MISYISLHVVPCQVSVGPTWTQNVTWKPAAVLATLKVNVEPVTYQIRVQDEWQCMLMAAGYEASLRLL
jgi:hypothetical protein